MTIYSDLCREFDVWRNRHFENHHKSLRLVGRIAEGFRRHIGAPQSFKIRESDNEKRYIILLKATDAGNDRVQHDEVDNHFDVSQRWDDGFYHFGVGVYVEVASNVWPKQCFPIPIYFIIEQDECIVHVTNRPEGEFRFKLDEVEQCTKMYDFMVSIITPIFQTNPWDFALHKTTIGFVPLK